MLVALPGLGFGLLLMAFMPNLWTTAVIVMAFFFAYYTYEAPYRGLYPDVLPSGMFGRSQSVQHVLRGIAIGIALVGGGFLFKAWRPSPFILAALVTTAACGLVVYLVQEDGGHGRVFEGFLAYVRRSWSIFWEDGEWKSKTLTLHPGGREVADPRARVRAEADERCQRGLVRPVAEDVRGLRANFVVLVVQEIEQRVGIRRRVPAQGDERLHEAGEVPVGELGRHAERGVLAGRRVPARAAHARAEVAVARLQLAIEAPRRAWRRRRRESAC